MVVVVEKGKNLLASSIPLRNAWLSMSMVTRTPSPKLELWMVAVSPALKNARAWLQTLSLPCPTPGEE